MNLQDLMHGVIATKVGMSRVFLPTGDAVPVTYLKVEPNTIVRVKTKQKDGYDAVVLGTRKREWKSRNGKDQIRYRTEKEWQPESLDGLTVGAQLTAAALPVETVVTVTGVSKGKGFQGVMRRHGFAGGPGSHGSHFKREPGSVGMRTDPGRIHKGKRMAGRMGGDKITVHNCAVLSCDVAAGVVAVKGPVPGPNGSTVYLSIEKWPEGFELSSVFAAPVEEVKEEPKVEEKTEEVKVEETKTEEAPVAEAPAEAAPAADEPKSDTPAA